MGRAIEYRNVEVLLIAFILLLSIDHVTYEVSLLLSKSQKPQLLQQLQNNKDFKIRRQGAIHRSGYLNDNERDTKSL